MRRHKLNWIWIILLGLFVGSCEDYLDRSPDDGLSEDDVYKDYSSLLGFMDRIFQNDDILIFTHGINSYSNTYVTVGNLSDEYASVRDNDPSKFVNAGNWLENAGTRFEIGSKSDGKNFKSAISRAYTGLRIVNRVISGVDQVKSITDDQRRKLLGQAHFLRTSILRLSSDMAECPSLTSFGEHRTTLTFLVKLIRNPMLGCRLTWIKPLNIYL